MTLEQDVGENALFKNGHASVSKRGRFKNASVSKWFLDLFLAMIDSVSLRLKTLAWRKSAFKHWNTVECGNRLRVGVRAKNAVACRGLRVGPSKVCNRDYDFLTPVKKTQRWLGPQKCFLPSESFAIDSYCDENSQAIAIIFVRAVRLQNETAPENLLIWHEKRFEKREKRSERRSETCLKHF